VTYYAISLGRTIAWHIPYSSLGEERHGRYTKRIPRGYSADPENRYRQHNNGTRAFSSSVLVFSFFCAAFLPGGRAAGTSQNADHNPPKLNYILNSDQVAFLTRVFVSRPRQRSQDLVGVLLSVFDKRKQRSETDLKPLTFTPLSYCEGRCTRIEESYGGGGGSQNLHQPKETVSRLNSFTRARHSSTRETRASPPP
jgi:hypothetical protein